MARAYSSDLRERVVGEIEEGATRREAAERFPELGATNRFISLTCPPRTSELFRIPYEHPLGGNARQRFDLRARQ